MATTKNTKAALKTEKKAVKKAEKQSKALSEKLTHPASPAKPTSAAKVARKLLDKLTPLGATTRAALRSLATDAQRSDLGGQTKARGVLADGVAMAIAIDQQMATFPSLTETYALPRFAYFLESLLALDALIEGSSARDAKVGAARGTAATAYERADKARTKLLKRLDRFAGLREAEATAVARLPPKGRSSDDLRQALDEAIKLAVTFRGRADDESKELTRIAALDEAVVEQAIRASGALEGAHIDAALEGKKVSRDSPIVNLEEGNVLLEMAYAMDVFEEAHGDNDVVSRLLPGAATRHVLAATPRAAASPAPEAAAGGAAPNGSAAPTVS